MPARRSPHLQDHFYGENASEHVVKVVEDVVALRVFSNRVLGCQGNAAGADDNHDEQIKVAQVDHKVTESANAETQREETCKGFSSTSPTFLA